MALVRVKSMVEQDKASTGLRHLKAVSRPFYKLPAYLGTYLISVLLFFTLQIIMIHERYFHSSTNPSFFIGHIANVKWLSQVSTIDHNFNKQCK